MFDWPAARSSNFGLAKRPEKASHSEVITEPMKFYSAGTNGSSPPFGTCFLSAPHPALKRRAIIGCPSGTKKVRMLNPNALRHPPLRAACLVCAGFVFLTATGLAGERGLAAQEGIQNFGKISDRLYRGAQPDAAGLKRLKELGVKTIINLRMTGDVWQAEPVEACANAMAYTNVPLSSIIQPTEEQIRKVLSLIESSPGPVFVHCQFGCDRTGTVIACYRIQHDQWSAEAALREADQYGMSRWERGMKSFILDFARSKDKSAHGNSSAR
jgi:tyrosine-protein phosphatase SIW14